MPARAIKSVSKPQQRHLKILVLIWSEGREGEEEHMGNTGKNCKSSFKGGKSHQFAILPIHQESVPKGHRKQERRNTVLELKRAFRVSLLYK